MRRLTFYQKLWIPLALSLLCVTAVATFGVLQNKMTGLAERERGLREVGDIATTIVSRYGNLVATGRLSPEVGSARRWRRFVRFGSARTVISS
jgi:methyl-accepting chemotaxis protein